MVCSQDHEQPKQQQHSTPLPTSNQRSESYCGLVLTGLPVYVRISDVCDLFRSCAVTRVELQKEDAGSNRAAVEFTSSKDDARALQVGPDAQSLCSFAEI